MTDSIQYVAITGGTHGNELTGASLIRHWLSSAEEVERSSFTTEMHLANPEAYKEIRRYIDQDLNRQFNINDLKNSKLNGCEQRRAKALDALLGPKADPRIDFIIDLHTTTANMGMTLVINSSDPLVVGMAFYIKQKVPEATLFYEPVDRLQNNFLISLGRVGGLLIEVGPIAQGLMNYEIYSATHTAVMHALDYLQLKNEGQNINLPSQMPGYQFIKKVSLPTNDKGEIIAMIHPHLQDKDYQAIEPGDPLFVTLAGENIYYKEESKVFGAFINEAAYYDQHIGLSFMKKIRIDFHNE